jgi:hypothetical protein
LKKERRQGLLLAWLFELPKTGASNFMNSSKPIARTV